MKTFTVVLLYPDYMSDDFGADTYVESVTAKDSSEAARKVQNLAQEANPGVESGDDFRPILVFAGDCQVLAGPLDF